MRTELGYVSMNTTTNSLFRTQRKHTYGSHCINRTRGNMTLKENNSCSCMVEA